LYPHCVRPNGVFKGERMAQVTGSVFYIEKLPGAFWLLSWEGES